MRIPTSGRRFFKQIAFLSGNLHHPSLHAKRYNEGNDVWQARINRDWRFYFIIVDDTYGNSCADVPNATAQPSALSAPSALSGLDFVFLSVSASQR